MEAHLVFISFPLAGHFYSCVEFAKLLVNRDHRLSVTVLVMTLPGTKPLLSLSHSREERISYVHLSHDGFVPDPTMGAGGGFMEYHMPQITDFLAELTRSQSTPPLAAVVVDVLCAKIIHQIDVPSYIFLVVGTRFLCLAFHALNQDLAQVKDSDTEWAIPGFVNSVPAKVLPTELTGGTIDSKQFLFLVAKFKDAKGIIVNTFSDLESHEVAYLLETETVPPIYHVGPILNLNGRSENSQTDSIISWLDTQPKSSVLFVCFGSMGCFEVDQVVEISVALEKSGTRFLWSLRRPPSKGQSELQANFESVTEILPEGFLERTVKTGKVIEWAPKVSVLSHPAVGGFLSHCGWNSVLESIWFGVPMATWPMFADNQINAFQLVKEWGLAVELKLDYRKDYGTKANYLVTAEEIEKAISQLMKVNNNNDNLIKQRVKDMSEKSKITVAKGGSSFAHLDRFVEGVIRDTNFDC